MAPDPGHLLATTDDTRALALADHHPGLQVVRDPEAALVVTGPQEDVSAYVSELVRAGIDLRAFNQTQTPLEALFFMLTDDSTHQTLDRPTEPTRARPVSAATTAAPAAAVDATPATGRRPASLRHCDGRCASSRAQYRAKAVLIGAAVLPIIVVVVMHGQSRPPKDTLFGRFATVDGFALALLILGFAAQWVLPLLTAIVAGDIFASEDQHGTWKTVLTRSTSRAQLFWAKTLTAGGFAVLVLAVLATSTIVSSVLIVGHQPLIGLSGQTIPATEALRLVALSWATMLPAMLGFTCLAILLSVWSPQPRRRHRRPRRDRHGHAARRRARWHRGDPPVPAHHRLRGLARPVRRHRDSPAP